MTKALVPMRMTLRKRTARRGSLLIGLGLAVGLAGAPGCSPADPGSDPLGTSTGGTSSRGGQPGSGGGLPGSGGMVGAGGAGVGGASAGGSSPVGGASAGGSSPAGGASAGGASTGGASVAGTGGRAATSGSGGSAVSGGSGGAPLSGVPVFVAAGYRGRTTISCDDGASWVANHSDDDSVCPNHFCGEVFNLITGLTFGHGYFFMTRGWGMPGNVLRSQDAVNWSQIHSGQDYGGIAYGSGTLAFAGGWQEAWYSSNDGQTISTPRNFASLLGAAGTIRNVSYHPYGGGRFILVPDDGVGLRKFMVSTDLGKTYSLATTATGQDMCPSRVTDVVSGGDLIVSSSYETGWVCRSLDGGASWTGKQISTMGLSRQMIWTGSEFLVYGGGSGYRSTDGDTWTKFALTPANLRFGAMARSSISGTIVASSPAGVDYGAQAFYRSSDGVTWQKLAAGKFVGSHLIEHMSFGAVANVPACP